MMTRWFWKDQTIFFILLIFFLLPFSFIPSSSLSTTEQLSFCLSLPLHQNPSFSSFFNWILQIRSWPSAYGLSKPRFAIPPRNLISHHISLCVRLWVGIKPRSCPTSGAFHQLQGPAQRWAHGACWQGATWVWAKPPRREWQNSHWPERGLDQCSGEMILDVI